MTFAISLSKLAEMHTGRRVRAGMSIFYAESGDEILEGQEGLIVSVSHGGALVAVRWDGEDGPRETCWEALDILPPKGGPP